MTRTSLTFLGGTGTVTGSKFLLDTGEAQILVDCGLFQGFKQLRLRNRTPLPIAPAALEAVVLTHAHLDHSGYLPLLVRDGFRGRVLCTAATAALCGILLPDSARLQEADAAFANRHGFSRHHPAEPLYTEVDAERALKKLRRVDFDRPFEFAGGLSCSFSRAGHILGASSVLFSGPGRPSVLFSGDLGRRRDLLMNPPAPRPAADYVVIESTYGDRSHGDESPAAALAGPIRRTLERGGVVLIPAFAVGRTQTLLVLLHEMLERGAIPRVPVYIDSPMASAVTDVYLEHGDEHRLTPERCRAAFRIATHTRSVDESKQIDAAGGPAIIISASGMATGGRVLHHLNRFLPDPLNTVILAGFQAGGTRGAALAGGAPSIKMFGRHVPVHAEIVQFDLLSAHADRDELLAWLADGPPPRRVFVVHGEPAASDALRLAIEERLGYECSVPDYRDTVELT
jgi:metallo-beta-lactamase family protein